ncbi:hypothetical protein AB0395_35150 [Streptosporangium sp. NPDC051023]|uniref:hypothetical protein n=1 Tax=Streptosporangium sp. NPDC051023 TaxID=3155410 RepID=UPI00344F6CF7
MTTPTPTFATALDAIEQARKYVLALEGIVDYEADDADKEPGVRLLSIAARDCLEQARGMHLDERLAPELTNVHKALVFNNETFYLAMSHQERCRLAAARGFIYPEHTEWSERTKPALVFWLNDAYAPTLIEKARVQARAYARAGRLDMAVQTLTTAALAAALSEGATEEEAAEAIRRAATEGNRLLERLAA